MSFSVIASSALHTSPELSRRLMIERQLIARDITDHRVLAAMAKVPRELFVPPEAVDDAYADHPLVIAGGQTISQPYIVALMTQALDLQPLDRVLEIGTGSGYSAAVLSMLVDEVFTVERLPELANTARERLATLNYRRIRVQCSDGTLGWPEHAPYQAISVTAAGPSIPPSLLGQLAIGGRIVMPIESGAGQVLVRATRIAPDTYTTDELGAVQFVSLIGEEAWPDDQDIPCTD
jgi:protein-L-isoaspartate(D-aspartate) O-methyltransferase